MSDVAAAAPTAAQEAAALAAEQQLAALIDQPALQANAVTGIWGDSGCLVGSTGVRVKRGISRKRPEYSLAELYLRFNGLCGRAVDALGRIGRDRQWDLTVPTFMPSLGDDGVMFYNRVVAVFESGIKPLVRVAFNEDRYLRLTHDHPVMTTNGFVQAASLKEGMSVLARGTMEYVSQGGRDLSARPPRVIVNTKWHPYGSYKLVEGCYEYVRVPRARLVVEAALNDMELADLVHVLKYNAEVAATLRYIPTEFEVHHLDEDTLNDDLSNLVVLTKAEHAKIHWGASRFPIDSIREIKVVSIEDVPSEMTYDVQMEAPANNFCANGVVVHNTGKTALICTAAEYAWETFHRITRYYAADEGGYGNKLLSLIRLGIVEAWNVKNHVEPFETAELVSMGWWPETIIDKETGYADPYVRLIPPQRRRYQVNCPHGHAVKVCDDKLQLQLFQMQCPECKEMTTPANWSSVNEIVSRSPGFKHVGLWAVESGSSLSDWVMNDMADRAGRDELGGEKGAISKIVSGSFTFGANNRAHYGFAQLRMQQWLSNLRRIPGQVVPPIVTFLADRGETENKQPVSGPKIAGSAKTWQLPGWMGNCLHTTKEYDPAATDDVWRLWVTGHSYPNEGNVRYLAKHRAEPGTFDTPFLQDAVNQPFSKFSMKYFFMEIDKSFAKAVARDANLYPDAPAFKPFEEEDEEVIATRGMSAAQIAGRSTTVVPGSVTAPMSASGGINIPMAGGMPAGGVIPMGGQALVTAQIIGGLVASVIGAPAGRPPIPGPVGAPPAGPAPAPPAAQGPVLGSPGVQAAPAAVPIPLVPPKVVGPADPAPAAVVHMTGTVPGTLSPQAAPVRPPLPKAKAAGPIGAPGTPGQKV